MAFHARKSSTGEMLVMPRLTVENYLDLCESSASSVIDFCHQIIEFLPLTGCDTMDVFYLLLAARIRFISPNLTISLDDEESLQLDLGSWFERGQRIFSDEPRTMDVVDGDITVTVGLPLVETTHAYNLRHSENSVIGADEFERDIQQDFYATSCHIRQITVEEVVFRDESDIRAFLEQGANQLYERVRRCILGLSERFTVTLCEIPGEELPLNVNPLNAVEVARMLFSENPDSVLNTAYVLGKHAHIDAFTRTPAEASSMIEMLLSDQKSEKQ